MITYSKYLREKTFMVSPIMDCSIATFLFKTSRNPVVVRRLEELYEEFITNHLEDATINESLSIDLILKFVEIESITEFMKEEFIKLVRIDNSVLEVNAYNVLLGILCEPAFFFNLTKQERR